MAVKLLCDRNNTPPLCIITIFIKILIYLNVKFKFFFFENGNNIKNKIIKPFPLLLIKFSLVFKRAKFF